MEWRMMGPIGRGKFQHLLLLLLQMSLMALMNCQNIVVKRVVEGHSTNVVIVCDLPSSDTYIQYWNISDQVYNRGSVPDVFDVSYRDLVIPQVKRAMEGLSFQCFTFRFGLDLGQTTILRVIRQHAPSQSENLLQPSMRRGVIFHYQHTIIDLNNITLAWFYHDEPSSSCGQRYEVVFYSPDNIRRASSQNDLTPIDVFNPRNHTQHYYTRSEVYASIVAMDDANVTCAKTDYFLNIKSQEPIHTTQIYSNGPSAQFEIPSLSDDTIFELVWSKNDSVQCACPPVEDIISRCACNEDNYDNTIIIRNHTLNITNLTGNLALYFITSSSGCNGDCSTKSIARIYSIIAYEDSVTATVSTSNDQCELYQVKLESISTTSVDIKLICLAQQSTLDFNITHGSTLQMVTIACNSTVRKNTLQPETEYMISYSTCLPRTFRTESFNAVLVTSLLAIGTIGVMMLSLISLIIIICHCLGCTCHCYRSHMPKKKDKTDELYQIELHQRELNTKL